MKQLPETDISWQVQMAYKIMEKLKTVDMVLEKNVTNIMEREDIKHQGIASCRHH